MDRWLSSSLDKFQKEQGRAGEHLHARSKACRRLSDHQAWSCRIIKAWLLDLQRPPAVNDNFRGSEIALGPDARLDASCQALGGEDTHSQGSQLRHALGSMA